jgi:hypothetical protein
MVREGNVDRLDADIDQARVEYWRDYNKTAAEIEDTDLPLQDRRDRPDCLHGSNVKRDDDVLILDQIPLRVVGPGRGRKVIIGYYPPWFGDEAQSFEIEPGDLTDRAPADPLEPPLPIWPEEEEPPTEPPPEPTPSGDLVRMRALVAKALILLRRALRMACPA